MEWKLSTEAKEQCKMITNFQWLVTLSTLGKPSKNVLPYSDDNPQILSSRIPLENKAIIKESSVKPSGLEKSSCAIIIWAENPR